MSVFSGRDQDEQRKTLSREEIQAHNLGVDFEKSAQVATLAVVENGQIVKIYNTHPGLVNAHRLAAMDVLSAKIAEDRINGISVVVAGDMNQFDMRVTEPKVLEEQPLKLTQAGLTWLSRETLLERGAQATFMAYSYDIMRFLTKNDKEYLFSLNDRAKALKKQLVEFGEDPNQHPELQGIYHEIRTFYQNKQQELFDTHSGAGLSTVLDFLGVLGPLFQQAHEVRSLTWYRGGLFNTTTIESRSAFEKELYAANTGDAPLISDHFALQLSPV